MSKLKTDYPCNLKYWLMYLSIHSKKIPKKGCISFESVFLHVGFTETSLLSDAAYVLCLDALGSGDVIHFHVSKPPKEGSAADILVQVRLDLL